MKKILLSCAMLAAVVACSKSSFIQPCKRWIEIKKTYKDSASGYIRTDTMHNELLCDTTYIGQVLRAKDSTWLRVCPPESQVTLHWELWIEQIKDE